MNHTICQRALKVSAKASINLLDASGRRARLAGNVRVARFMRGFFVRARHDADTAIHFQHCQFHLGILRQAVLAHHHLQLALCHALAMQTVGQQFAIRKQNSGRPADMRFQFRDAQE